jgi:hypothetical protein
MYVWKEEGFTLIFGEVVTQYMYGERVKPLM